MKTLILSLSIATIFAACGKPASTDETKVLNEIVTPDTTGLSEYKQWKEQQNVVSMEGLNEIQNPDEITENKVVKSAPVRSYRKPAVTRRNPVVKAPTVEPAPEKIYGSSETGTRNSTSRNDEPVATAPSTSTGPIISNEPTVAVPETKEKKGWSKAAKGTAIGAGSGAVLGAIISKNKGKGAIIGGVIGAAGGYVLGRTQDKKDGRY